MIDLRKHRSYDADEADRREFCLLLDGHDNAYDAAWLPAESVDASKGRSEATRIMTRAYRERMRLARYHGAALSDLEAAWCVASGAF